MKKLKLEIEAVEVSTFATDATGAGSRGTVPANDLFAPTQAMTCSTCTRHTDPCLCTPAPPLQ